MSVLAFMRPETARIFLLVSVGVGYAAYHVVPWLKRWYKLRRVKARVADTNPVVSPACDEKPEETPESVAVQESPDVKVVAAADVPAEPLVLAPGEDLFAHAREMPHQVIPDFNSDGEYLGLLGQSAALGFAPAQAKLGEYAMRRAAWVEAYYWMMQARRNGMHNLDDVLQEICDNWVGDDCPDEAENTNAIFTHEAGSIGRAWLDIASGRDEQAAVTFLQTHYPEYL